MLKTMIWEAGHKYILLLNFHCELNPIEIMSSSYLLRYSLIYFLSTIVLGMGPDGLSIGIVKSTRTHLEMPKMPLRMPSTHVPLRWSDNSSTTCGDGCWCTAWDSQERLHSGPYTSKKVIAVPQGLPWYIWMPFLMVLRLTLIICTSVTTQTRFLPLKMLQLLVLKRHGKFFEGVFFNSFQHSEEESWP